MAFRGPAARPPRGWQRPAALLRQMLRLRAEPEVDYDFARMSRHRYVGRMAPDPATASETLRHEVDRLAGQHALDEGNAAVFDPVIDAWVDDWTNQIEVEHGARQSVLQQREEHAQAEVYRLGQLEQLLRARIDAEESDIAALLAVHRPSRTRPPRQRAGEPNVN